MWRILPGLILLGCAISSPIPHKGVHGPINRQRDGKKFGAEDGDVILPETGSEYASSNDQVSSSVQQDLPISNPQRPQEDHVFAPGSNVNVATQTDAVNAEEMKPESSEDPLSIADSSSENSRAKRLTANVPLKSVPPIPALVKITDTEFHQSWDDNDPGIPEGAHIEVDIPIQRLVKDISEEGVNRRSERTAKESEAPKPSENRQAEGSLPDTAKIEQTNDDDKLISPLEAQDSQVRTGRHATVEASSNAEEKEVDTSDEGISTRLQRSSGSRGGHKKTYATVVESATQLLENVAEDAVETGKKIRQAVGQDSILGRGVDGLSTMAGSGQRALRIAAQASEALRAIAAAADALSTIANSADSLRSVAKTASALTSVADAAESLKQVAGVSSALQMVEASSKPLRSMAAAGDRLSQLYGNEDADQIEGAEGANEKGSTRTLVRRGGKKVKSRPKTNPMSESESGSEEAGSGGKNSYRRGVQEENQKRRRQSGYEQEEEEDCNFRLLNPLTWSKRCVEQRLLQRQ